MRSEAVQKRFEFIGLTIRSGTYAIAGRAIDAASYMSSPY
jgi:hypothetical protein